MRFTSAALVAGLATLSSAFLIPSTNLDELVKDTRFKVGKEKFEKTFIDAVRQKKTAVVDLDCPGCPYATKYSEERGDGPAEQGIVWTDGIENKIHLEFDTNVPGLRVNSHQIYPLDSLISAPEVRATQVRSDNHEHSVDVPLNFALEESGPVHPPFPGIEITSLRLTILGLNGIPVKADTVLIHVVKTPDNEHYIPLATTVPFEHTPGAKVCDTGNNWSLCRLKSLIASHVKSVMDTFRAKADKAHSWVAEKHHSKAHGCGKSRPKHHGGKHGDTHDPQAHHHHKFRHHHRMHRLSHLLRKTLRFFIIPALLGVCGGLAASAIGMLVGRAIVFLWCKFARGGQRGPLRTRETQIIIAEDEKEGLLIAEVVEDSDEPVENPPRYTDIEAEAETETTDPDKKN